MSSRTSQKKQGAYMPSKEYCDYLAKIAKKYGDYHNPYPQVYDDGGRFEAGYTSFGIDCATRAIAVVTGYKYATVERIVNEACDRFERRIEDHSQAQDSIHGKTYKRILTEVFEMEWHRENTTWHKIKFPPGRHIINLSGHVSTVINGVIHDSVRCNSLTYSRIYGYYTFNTNLRLRK